MQPVFFYHLTQSGLIDTLMLLLDKAMQKPWRVTVRGGHVEQMREIDAALWRGPEDAFVGHGMQGGPHDGFQPVLLTTGLEVHEDREFLIAIGNAPVRIEDVQGNERVAIVFDGENDEQLRIARDHWRVLTAAGCDAQYWSEETGRWTMKAQKKH